MSVNQSVSIHTSLPTPQLCACMVPDDAKVFGASPNSEFVQLTEKVLCTRVTSRKNESWSPP